MEGGLMTGLEVGSYILESELGRGGMGEVYLARHKTLGTWAAIKVMSPAFSADHKLRERFSREARTQAQLQHPHIARVLDHVEKDGRWFLIIEYMKSGTLEDVLDRSGEPVPVPEALAWTRQALLGLDHAHRQGIIHRDVKPANILINDRGEAAVTDFGIAVEVGAQRLTRTGISIGTPEYMSPEQIRGADDLDHRTDVYSMGIVLYELLAARVPFQSPSTFEVQRAQVTEPPPPLSRLRPDLPPALEGLVTRALAKDPQERYPSCGEFARAIETYEPGEAVAAEPAPRRTLRETPGAEMFPPPTGRPATVLAKPSVPPPPLPPPAGNKRSRLALVAVIAAVLVAAVFFWPVKQASDGGSAAVAAARRAQEEASKAEQAATAAAAAEEEAETAAVEARDRARTAETARQPTEAQSAAAGADRAGATARRAADTAASEASKAETAAAAAETAATEAGVEMAAERHGGRSGLPFSPVGVAYADDGEADEAARAAADAQQAAEAARASATAARESAGAAAASAEAATRAAQEAQIAANRVRPPTPPDPIPPAPGPAQSEPPVPPATTGLPPATTGLPPQTTPPPQIPPALPLPEQPVVTVMALGDPVLTAGLEGAIESRLLRARFDVVDEHNSLALSDLLRRREGDVDVSEILPILVTDGFHVAVLIQVEIGARRELRVRGQSMTATSARVRLNAHLLPARRPLGRGWTEMVEYTELSAGAKAEQAFIGPTADLIEAIRSGWGSYRRQLGQ